jgi:hypothetical protein
MDYEESMMEKKDLVWYVSYGSNMLYERFMCYINGGKFDDKGRNHKKCKDTTPPIDKMNYELPYNMYYANKSKSWDNKGVSFLNISTDDGKAYGVAYLITKKQFDHIFEEENGGVKPSPASTWYNKKHELDSIDGIAVMTITNRNVIKKNNASERYLNVLFKGLQENYPSLSDEEINIYLSTRNDL